MKFDLSPRRRLIDMKAHESIHSTINNNVCRPKRGGYKADSHTSAQFTDSRASILINEFETRLNTRFP